MPGADTGSLCADTMKVDPLRHNVPIVDNSGRPLPQFIRLWQTLLRATVRNAGGITDVVSTTQEEYNTALEEERVSDTTLYVVPDTPRMYLGETELSSGSGGGTTVSARLYGSAATSGDLPPSGDVGEVYLVGTHLWFWNGAAWEDAGDVAGPAGADGSDGATGPAGEPGLSAYEVAVAEGYVGTEAEWLASLVGPEGPAGADAPWAANIPFYDAAGVYDPVPLNPDATMPFFDAAGNADNIPVTA